MAGLDGGPDSDGCRGCGAEWEYGDLAAGFADADVIIEEHSYHQSLSHQPLESRTTLAYWEGGKLFVYPSVQSTARSVGPMARWAGIEPSDVVLINEFTGGADSAARSSGYPQAQIPILLSKKIGKPVMMRVTRRDENARSASARPGVQARIKLGMRARRPRSPRSTSTAIGDQAVRMGGPATHMNVGRSSGRSATSRWRCRMRGTGVYTNTPPRGRTACTGRRAVDDDALADYPESGEAARARPG